MYQRRLNIMTSFGTIVRSSGIIIVISTRTNSTCLPGRSIRASAYAASVDVISEPATMHPATIRLFARYRKKR